MRAVVQSLRAARELIGAAPLPQPVDVFFIDSPWLQEGLAQVADGRCANHSNSEVAVALAVRHGWIDLEIMLNRFRELTRARLDAIEQDGWGFA